MGLRGRTPARGKAWTAARLSRPVAPRHRKPLSLAAVALLSLCLVLTTITLMVLFVPRPAPIQPPAYPTPVPMRVPAWVPVPTGATPVPSPP